MGSIARPTATEPFAPLGRHSTSLQLTTMQQLIDAGSNMHSLLVLLSAVEMGCAALALPW